MQNNQKIKVLNMFLDSIGVKKSKGRTYLETLLNTFDLPHIPLTIIYQTIANIHQTTPQNVEFNIRYAKNNIKEPTIKPFSWSPVRLTNKEFINELIICFNNELRNPNLINKKTW